MPKKQKLKLSRCDINECQAMCCYDGVYLQPGEEEKIRAIVSAYPTHFSHLPEAFIVDGSWNSHANGRKTAVRTFEYREGVVPPHWNQTRCVFATDDNKCSLQTASAAHSDHPWDFKPRSCWLFPLHEKNNRIVAPPMSPETDPHRLGAEYPGYTSFTCCGKSNCQGEDWNFVLKEELTYRKQTKKNNK